MSDQFKRQYDTKDETKEGVLQAGETGWSAPDFIPLLIGMVIFFGLLIGIWQMWQTRLAESESELREQVQTVLYLEHIAVLNGDGALFLSLQEDDPAWISAQLWPENQAAARAGLTVTQVEQYSDFIQADATWTADGETLQRTIFFEERDGHLLHISTAPDYWGKPIRERQPWGTLYYSEMDSVWVEDIAPFVSERVAQICAANCVEERLPLTLVLAGDYGLTAAPHRLRLPSPRLLALDEEGAPAPLFWQTLQRQLEGYLAPATVRFAIPPSSNRSALSITKYTEIANRFMAAHPDITIELVNLAALPDDLGLLAAEFDGAAIPPTQAMLTAGLVHDLTDFMNTDPDFDQTDFYEQIWQGTRWQERTWWMPQSAIMPLIFYDKAAYRLANYPEPSLDWTWTEMTQDVTALIAAQPEKDTLVWGFIDPNMDTLFSYAYNWNNRCPETATVRCQNPLQPQNMIAALDWYSQMAGQPEKMPDLTGLTPFERDTIMLTLQGAKRQAVIWTDLPINYEYRFLLAPLGVVPFPGSDKFAGITPLWVQGSFISRQSERPLATWQWLKFLSYQKPVPRLIPARPSIATEMNFWGSLPPQLGDAMRVAFPFARPVTLEDQNYLSWAQIKDVLSGELSPTDVVFQQPDAAWFGQD